MRIAYRFRLLHTKRQKLAVLALLVTLMLFPADMLYDRITPILAECASSAAMTEISEAVSKTASQFDFGELVVFEDLDRLYTDTKTLNDIKATFAASLTRSLKKNTVKVEVPLGDIIGLPSTLGRGPCLPVRITGYSAAVTDVQSEFISAGINQTLHRISMTVNVECTLILPRLKTHKISQTATVPLSETVIIGDVPSYYR